MTSIGSVTSPHNGPPQLRIVQVNPILVLLHPRPPLICSSFLLNSTLSCILVAFNDDSLISNIINLY